MRNDISQKPILVQNWNVSNRFNMPLGNLVGFIIGQADMDRCHVSVDLISAQS